MLTVLTPALASIPQTQWAGFDHYSCCISQGLVQKYELNKKWFYFYAGALGAAYLYLRPLIRRKLGSAERRDMPHALHTCAYSLSRRKGVRHLDR